MQEEFKIWIDRLTEGTVQKINGSFNPTFLEIEEKELQFHAPVRVIGEAYLADQHLVVHLKAETKATMPCAICNQMIDTDVKIENFYHSEPISEIPSAVFDLSAPLREALLIELPHYLECGGGKCPERPHIAPYLRSGSKTDSKNTKNFPFADL